MSSIQTTGVSKGAYNQFHPATTTTCQIYGKYKFSLTTSGYHAVTDMSLGLCSWDLQPIGEYSFFPSDWLLPGGHQLVSRPV